MKKVLLILVALCVGVWFALGHKEKKKPKPPVVRKEVFPRKASSPPPEIVYKTTPYPFIIEPDHRKIYLYEKASSKLTVIEGKKGAKPAKLKKTIKRLARYGLEDALCYKLAGKRFICIFKDASYKEASLHLDCDVLIAASRVYATKFPQSIKSFLNEWVRYWENIKKNFSPYASLYSADFKNAYGTKKEWLNLRKKELSKTKYIDILVANVSMFIIPNSSLYVILFDQTYRSNLRRIDSRKALVLKIENNKPLIVSEVVL